MISTHLAVSQLLLLLFSYCFALDVCHEKQGKKTSQAFFWLSVIWVYLESCEAVSSAASVVMFS